eukprot:TRINITY_DN9640_c0_g2_i1.p1 TRINITY_DN9640_c0_g2~~TRINITY_DN9640_c0_g2_i1.p1  ORF type:complete len:339 (+),score=3.47 TRINITY_DN9640_c0_g2_i1:40-1056(+)
MSCTKEILSHGMWGCPLIEVKSPNFSKVAIYIDNPLWSANVNLLKPQVLSVCTRLSTAIHRKHPKDSLLRELEMLASRAAPNRSSKEFLHWLGLHRLFPEIIRCLDGAIPSMLVDATCTMTGYLALMSYHNQVFEIARLLRKDLTELEDHKYVAHQLVLLHQSVSKCGASLEAFKREIESHFERLKAEIEDFNESRRLLSEAAIAWMSDMLSRLGQQTLRHLTQSPAPHMRDLRELAVRRPEAPCPPLPDDGWREGPASPVPPMPAPSPPSGANGPPRPAAAFGPAPPTPGLAGRRPPPPLDGTPPSAFAARSPPHAQTGGRLSTACSPRQPLPDKIS